VSAAGTLQNAGEVDNIAPAPFSDLRIASQVDRSVMLNWTAPGDDGNVGQASLYEIRFVDQNTNTAFLLATQRPAAAGTAQSVNLKVPFRHPAGSFLIRTTDNAGNAADSGINVSVSPTVADPYTITAGPAASLSTGGDALHLNFDDFVNVVLLPFDFPFYDRVYRTVWISSNGVLYFGNAPIYDAISSTTVLNGREMIAGLWDDLDMRTCFRSDSDVYAITPDNDRVIYRWQGVKFTSPDCPGSPNGQQVNFEIELHRDGTIQMRYGQNPLLFPVVGIGGGEPEGYVVASHTSESVPINLTNAQTLTFTRRYPIPTPTPTPTPTADLEIQFFSAAPNPVTSGQQLTFAITARNNGPAEANGVQLSILLPSGTRYISCETSQGFCNGTAQSDGGTVTASFGSLSASMSGSMVVVTEVTASGGATVTSTASLTSATTDPNPNNNTNSASTSVLEAILFSEARAISISAEGRHALVLRGGTVWAWGHNYYGQLGDGTTNNRNQPVQVEDLMFVKAVSAGVHLSVALKADGTVWTWGTNEHGQLGTGLLDVTYSSRPVRVTNLSSVVAIAAGASHTLALKSDGTVWVWGWNSIGELGIGGSDFAPHPTPTQVQGLPRIWLIAAGSETSFAAAEDGSVWAWGANFLGQLGDGSTVTRPAPVRLTGISNVRAIAVGAAHTVAVRFDGTVWAWGGNHLGRLGLGTSDTVPHPEPTQLDNLRADSIAAGYAHTGIVDSAGMIKVWGANNSGQLGIGSNDLLPHSMPIPVPTLASVFAVAAGGDSTFALIGNTYQGGTIRAWGSNDFGVLGTGAVTPSYAPAIVAENVSVARPIFSNLDSVLAGPTNVYIACGTPGAVTHYTTNGEDPSESDPSITSGGSILIDHSLMLKARAWRNGFIPSPVTSRTYNVGPLNPIDDARNFVRQHYLDFLAREPDQNGWDYWTNEITSCGADPVCIHNRRIAVSDAFFFEPEFQQTGSFVLRLYRAAFGNDQPLPNPDLGNPSAPYYPGPEFHLKFPSYAAFTQDRAQVVGGPDLAQSQLALANDFVQRPEFLTKYPAGLSGPEFVNGILASIASASSSDLSSQSVTLNNLYNQGGRGLVMFHLANDYWNGCGATPAPCVPSNVGPAVDNRPFIDAEYNLIFVTTEYFGYLRRDGDANGLNFWWIFQVNRFPLRQPDIQHAMVCSFITSAEYQLRFGGTLTRSNQDCPQ
ncbi:MAG TPA: chitobiase/beta-hexosaminidase C-terminal domain-containing protein, partial [Pyrinomonadaceae bacterium]|nr:chitobiase/beta-hexosaminidase C-terminal domain-containing protein [Pyrinomonadaceae bacterium]